MKYMLIMRATDEAFASFADVDVRGDARDDGPRSTTELISSGVLVAAEGLDDAEQGVVVDYSSTPPVVTDGPYGETKELFGGFWHPRRRLEGGGRRVGQAGADDRAGHRRPRSAGCRASTSSRRTTRGSSGSGRGGRRHGQL